MEALIGRRPHDTYVEVRDLLRSLSRVPYVAIIDLAHARHDIVTEIAETRRWLPLAVFVLYCSEDEYARSVATVSDDWKVRLSRFFRLPKTDGRLSRTRLRTLLDAATRTAIDKVKNARVYSAFISYSHADRQFAEWLHATLEERGIRCWRDAKQLKAGDRLHSQIESAIAARDKVLLCASRASLTSWWVDNELNSVIAKEQAQWKEAKEESLVLIPLNLDGFMFTDDWKSGWKNQVTSRLAADFTRWHAERSWDVPLGLSTLVRALIVDAAADGSPFSEV
jgi:hypothetical protein